MKIFKSKIRKYVFTSFLISLILISFFVSNPNPDFEYRITYFSIEGEKDQFRTNYPINVSFEILGTPSEAVLIWGDGNIENIQPSELNEENGVLYGSLIHNYSIQGKFFPKLHIWDNKGRLNSRFVDLTIQNNPLQFKINLSCGTQAFEDQEVLIDIQDLFELNEGLDHSFENFTYLYDFSDSQITSKESSIASTWKNSGIYPITVSIIDGQGTISRRTTTIEVINQVPNAFYEILSSTALHAQSKIHFTARKCSDTASDKNTLQYIWDMGDNTTVWGKHVYHMYSKAGLYRITLTVIDDDASTHSYSRAIWVNEAEIEQTSPKLSDSEILNPYIAIGSFPEELYEDEGFQFTAIVDYLEENVTKFECEWEFGDGVTSFEYTPKHSWARAGTYNIKLTVLDTNGKEFLRQREITINEKTPEVLGPFSFQAIEGQVITLDVEVYDALLDIPNLNFYWYNERGELFSVQKTPIVVLNDGNYTYTLNVTDQSGFTSSRDINIIVFPCSPEIYIPNYMYYGPPGEIILRAYGYDCIYDNSELEFRWSITYGKDKEFLPDRVYNNYSEISFMCEDTTIYQGQVEVTDPSGKVRVATFEIFSQVEPTSQKDKFSDFNKMYGLNPSQSQDTTTDSDGDNLSDYYENEISNTNYLVKDTDGDGLVDGYDDLGIGELTLGTSPIDADSDNDNLNDGLEYYGYEISINYFENSSIIQVSSDPLNNDTDNDNISDYEEYIAKSHPRLHDSDADGLDDFEDPYPTNWDFDGDFLSDFMEKNLGTVINVSDTDGDGIKDGEEVNGFGLLQFQTNPTYADTDGDFLMDNAEIMNYNVKVEDEYGKDIRVNVSEPITLHFSKFFTKAVAAQIAFTLSFGEEGSDNNHTYGILEPEVLNLIVRITKSDDDIVLYESTTNSTRHFSQVVDITKIMNNETLALNYYGDYVLEVSEAGGETIPGCLLEQFELDFCRYIDPNCDDFDGDGILDGVEMDTLVRGTDIIDIKDYYNCTSDGSKVEDIDEIYLDIPQTGRVFDAELFLSVNSEQNLLGYGNITLEIIKKNTNINIPDLTVLTHFEEFDIDDIFAYETTIDLSDFIDTNKMKDYYGKYFLKTVIHDTDLNDTFYVSNYHIEADTYIQARAQDTHAWITDPALSDSDGDGWSDNYEIFTSETNPLNRDTDGDKSWDSNDRDPLRNIMLEIRPISGKFKNQYWPWPTPTLQIIIKLHINDLIDPDFSEDSSNIGFCTTAQKASTDPTWWGAYQSAWWIYGEGHHYYIDINDDMTMQSNTIPIYFQLWQILSTGDVDIFAGSWLLDTYSINEVGHQQELFVSKNGDNINCIVETVALERANTIAIYNPNATVFNGHYQEQERMNIIQLHITEDGHYPASISFEHDETGETPSDWNDLSEMGQSPVVIDELDGHNKILQFHDTSQIFQGKMTYSWNGSYSTGFLEVWLRMSTTTGEGYFQIRDGSDLHSIRFRFDNSGYMQYKVGSTYYNIKEYNAYQWYHLRFQWDCSDDWHLWVDGISQDKGVGYTFKGSPLAMDGISIQTRDELVNYYYYVDAIGGVFDEYYKLGDNLERSTTEGTPFNPGLNIIVIPTSLFDKTSLNAHIQTGHLEDTPLYTEQKGLFEFYSIDRDGSIDDSQCGDTDFLFIRYGISPNDALEILNLLLLCALNQSLDENNNTITRLAKVYSYSSTKINGTDAVSMNLPQGLLSFIPWLSDHQNSPYGNTPETFNFLGILLRGVLGFIFPLVGLVMVSILSASLIVSFFAEVAKAIGLIILTFLAKLVWILIRVALLILFYIFLAIELLTTSIIFLSIGVLFSVCSGFSCKWGLDLIVPYAKGKRVGFIDFGFSGYNMVLEAHIEWIYWDLFDLYFPLVKMNSDQGSLLEDIVNKTSVEALPPELACGWEHIRDLKYDFHVEYRQRPEGYPPEYVKVVLTSPQSNQEFKFLMEITPGQQFDDYYDFVRFNYTIDFAEFDLDERQGQWYYYFISEASEIHTVSRWPYTGYAIGPLIEDLRYYFISSYLEPSSGTIGDNFTFSVMGGDFIDNFKPTLVNLNILWPNNTIQSFSMDAASIFPLNTTDLITYERTMNFSHYLTIDEKVELNYNFEAFFHDGKVSILWDYETLDENLDIDENLTNYTYQECWFEGPVIYPLYSSDYNSPIIRDWYVEDLTWDRNWNKESSDRVINPVSDEFILRFYVYIEDPDGSHEEHYRNGFEIIPELLLTNLDNPENPLEPIEMKYTGGNYGPGPGEYDEYFVDVIGAGYYAYKYENRSDLIKCDFGPGAWNFSFHVADNQSNSVLENSNKKIWHIGSFEEVQNSLFYGHHAGFGIGGLFGSIATTIAYISMAILASFKDPKLQIAAQVISTGILIYDLTMNIFSLITYAFETERCGSLLGLGLNLLLKSTGFLISLALSKNDVGRFDFSFLSKFAALSTAVMMLNLFNEYYSFNLETDEDGQVVITQDDSRPSIDSLLLGYPMMIVSFLSSIIGLTTSLFITSGYAKFGGGSDGVSKIIAFHTILSFAMSIMCIFMFLEKSGYFHIINDLTTPY